ncbi:MAG TPA: methylenetetrahydrofolate reductase [NAD(P)H] [Porticoccaceae bacterium]|nr:methylenetetrahydrofolate reductase [NAD(P)H] [Porticoccaceae bacterium]
MTERNWQLSFEFFPPKTEQGVANLGHTRKQLAQYAPTFFSVTYGAGGSTRANTQSTVLDITAAALDVAPHLSFGGDTEQAVMTLLDSYREAGIRRLVALRGDLPSGMGGAMQLVHANELVRFIRERFGDLFTLHVAAYPEIHPEARGYDDDVHWLAEKFKAGADQAITQYFYNVDAYWYFLERCRAEGIEQPVVPGVMPITNYRNLARFSANCGAEIPRWLQRRLEQYGDDAESLRRFGCEVVSQLCEKLLDGGAPGLHFYTMNQLEPTASILANLGEQPR